MKAADRKTGGFLLLITTLLGWATFIFIRDPEKQHQRARELKQSWKNLIGRKAHKA